MRNHSGKDIPHMVNVAVVGAGYWGPNLIRLFGSMPDVNLAAICDNDGGKLARLKRLYSSVSATTSFDEIIGNADINAVVLAVPASLHFSMGARALEAGKHCLIEKPLATTSEDCRKLITLAAKNNCCLMVGHTFEYNSAVRWIDDFIKKGELGNIYHVFSQRLNLGQVRGDVDAIWNLAPHDISIALYWIKSAPKYVTAQGFNYLDREPALVDMGFVTIEFENGIVAHIVVSWLSPEKVRKMFIVGSKKMVIFDDVNVEGKIQICDKGIDLSDSQGSSSSLEHDTFGKFQLLVRSGDMVIPNIPNNEPLRTECEHFIDCIRDGSKPISDGESGLLVTQILEGATLSIAQSGKKILLSEL